MEPHFGWLEKKSGGKEEQEASKKKSMGQRRGKWDRRYFVVLPAGDNKGQMMYYKDTGDWEKGKQPKGVMNLEEAELLLGDSGEELEFAVRCTRPPQSQGGAHALAFPSRVYVLRAATVTERAAFVEVLKRIIVKVQEGVDRDRLSSGETTTLRYTQGFQDGGAEDEYNMKGGGAKIVAKQRKEWYAFLSAQQKRPEVQSAKVPELVMDRPPPQLCRIGIPPDRRGQMWEMLSGSVKMRHANVGAYEALQVRSQPSGIWEHGGGGSGGQLQEETDIQIEKDLKRTFAENSEMQTGTRIDQLRRLLRAYAVYDPVIGYCQSLNFIAAILMLYMKEEQAFWTLAAVVRKTLPAGYYTHGMQGLRADHRVLSSLVAEKLPELHDHLTALDVPLEPVSTQWLMCMYLNVLPMNSVLRIWDTIFCEGSAVLMRVAVGLLKQHEEELLQCSDFGDAFMILQEMTKGDIDCEKLISVAFNDKLVGDFSAEHVQALRTRYSDEIRSEDATVNAAQQPSEKAKKEPAAAPMASQVQPQLEIALEDLPALQISGLDPEQIVPPTPSPTSTPKRRGDGSEGLPETPNSFGHSFGLDEEELRRGLADEDDDSESETQPQVAQQSSMAIGMMEEGVPPSSALAGDEPEWDDV